METLTRDKAFAPDGAPVAPPCAMIIFGAAGDLTKRLVVPALYNLVNSGRLPNEFQLVGVDLVAKTTEEWRADPAHANSRLRTGVGFRVIRSEYGQHWSVECPAML